MSIRASTSTVPPTAPTAWATGILTPAQAFGLTPLAAVSGTVPAGLRGNLYRNGPAALTRQDQTVGHWFDGDGGILAVHFRGDGVTATYQYVDTAGRQLEEQAGRFILAGYGMLPPGSWWQRLGKDVKNVANTSVMALPDRLLALWEGGMPHALDLQTLATRGLDDLTWLQGRPFSAHPKRDRQTGEFYNFGVTVGRQTHLNVYRCDRTGSLKTSTAIPLAGFPVIHDFAIAGRYLVFCIPPVRIQVLPLLARTQSFSDAMVWQPELGTEIIVLERDTLQVVSRTTTDAWYQWHFGNGCELADGSIQIELCRYPDFQTNRRLQEVATGAIQTFAQATLWVLRVQPQTGAILSNQEVLDRSCEFPVHRPQDVGQPWRYTYLSMHRATTDIRTELFDTIACFDHATGRLTEATLGDRGYPNEPIYAPDAVHPDQGWILTVVYDANGDRSEVWIFANDRLDADPVCRLALPHVVPIGFHGTWNPNP